MYSMKTILTSLLFLLSLISLGQKIDQMESFRHNESERYARISYDNDYFSETDKDYTQGYSFEFSSPFLKKNPINKILLKNKSINKNMGYL